MRDVYEVLKEKGITLPQPPARRRLYTSTGAGGEISLLLRLRSGSGKRQYGSGQTGKGPHAVEDGQKAAYNCVLNLLANLNEKDRGFEPNQKRFVKGSGFCGR